MEIEKIIYDTTREIYSVEDKLRIATIFIFCYKEDSKLFAELLYTKSHVKFIYNLNFKYQDYEVDFGIRLEDRNVKNSFYKTLEKVKEKYDPDGYYKALFNGDEFALAIYDIVNHHFDKVKLKKITQKIATQLSSSFLTNQ
jgi:hypothetical protein